MPPRTSPVVHRTTAKLLEQLHRDHVTHGHAETPVRRTLPRMRPYAEQLAYERGEA